MTDQKHHIKYLAGAFSGIAEVLITHPIDMYKTLLQGQARYGTPVVINNLYQGIGSRLVGIIPMRITFWCCQDIGNLALLPYFDHSPTQAYFLSGIIAGSFQTILDQPIELIKTKSIMNKQNPVTVLKNAWRNRTLYQGFYPNWYRNMLFAGILNSWVHYWMDSERNIDGYTQFIISASGGLIGSVISHPLDYLKTIIQSRNKNSIKYSLWDTACNVARDNPAKFATGMSYRSLLSITSMGIGFTTYTFIKQKMELQE